MGPAVRTAVLLTLISLLMVNFARADEWYVSPSGNDEWSGRRAAPNPEGTDGPFRTIVRARDAVRSEQSKRRAKEQPLEATTVWIAGGVYEFTTPLALQANDSGTEAAPVTYKAVPHAHPILVGGKKITDFVPYQGAILKADVAELGFKGKNCKLLTFSGERQTLARYPNADANDPVAGGWAYADGKRVPMYQNIKDESKRLFTVKEEDRRTWARPQEVEVFVFARFNWWNNIVRVKSLDPETGKLELAGDASYGIRPGDRYYFQNALEELDAPGEWYLNAEAGTLYFWPPGTKTAEESLAAVHKGEVLLPIASRILQLNAKTKYVTFQGLTFECCNGTAIEFGQSEHCQLLGCTVRGHGSSGVVLAGGSDCTVFGCDIYDVGNTGVFSTGGDRVTLTSCRHVIENNHIHHTGLGYKQGVGVGLGGVGTRVAHNEIHDTPRMAIMFGGNNFVIEYNHLHHVNLETEDTGAIYTGGRDWISSRGTVIRYNRIHDSLGFGHDVHGKWQTPYFAWGIYLDDNTGGIDVYGNIVSDCSNSLMHLHNGRDNHIENNIFVNGRRAQMECSGWTETHRFWTNHIESMRKGYEKVAGQPAWAKMRGMDIKPDEAVLPDKTIMSGNRFERNIYLYDSETAFYFKSSSMNFARNPSDYNVIWNNGKPIKTGVLKLLGTVGGNLIVNADFANPKNDGMPEKWGWQVHTPKAKVETLEPMDGSNGMRVLRIAAAFADRPKDMYPIVLGSSASLQPGEVVKLKARMKADEESNALFSLQSYGKNFFWLSSPNGVKVGPEWKDVEFVIRIPNVGVNWNPGMESSGFRPRIDYQGKSGSLYVTDVSLFVIDRMDDWEAWKAEGMDVHSVVADPKFIAGRNFQLAEDSPAWKLGFKAIPADKIGLYDDPRRATKPTASAAPASPKAPDSDSKD